MAQAGDLQKLVGEYGAIIVVGLAVSPLAR